MKVFECRNCANGPCSSPCNHGTICPEFPGFPANWGEVKEEKEESDIPEFIKTGNLVWSEKLGYCCIKYFNPPLSRFLILITENGKRHEFKLSQISELRETRFTCYHFQAKVYIGIPEYKNEEGKWVK